jgi:hypothetical protein
VILFELKVVAFLEKKIDFSCQTQIKNGHRIKSGASESETHCQSGIFPPHFAVLRCFYHDIWLVAVAKGGADIT